jgi:hypothetical protein
MGLGTSIFLIAVGAILKYAVTAQNENVDINAVGVILMVVGIIGACLSLLFWSSWGGLGTYGRRRTTVYEEPPVEAVVPQQPVAYDQPGVQENGRRRVVREEIRRERY